MVLSLEERIEGVLSIEWLSLNEICYKARCINPKLKHFASREKLGQVLKKMDNIEKKLNDNQTLYRKSASSKNAIYELLNEEYRR